MSFAASARDQAQDASAARLKALRAMLEAPEASIDLARLKVDIDRMIDPKVNAAKTLKQLDKMATVPYALGAHRL